MQTIDLNGPWSFRTTKKSAWQPAEVPGGVHQDLLRNGTIADPFYRDNEIAQRWIGESDWIYRRSFEVSEALLSETEVVLECDGLDTLAAILINGKPVAETDNMHYVAGDVMLRVGPTRID